MAWEVKLSTKVLKTLEHLPEGIEETFQLLLAEIRLRGPVRGNWANYDKLFNPKNHHKCHLHKGKPTYVATWRVISNQEKCVEVTYVGTHEKAPY
jgi:mRNA-degrading endonuclease RelE of RelBE toxin-antitoxin system